MSETAIVAYGAVSALGEGARAVSAGELGDEARLAIARDDALARAGLARPFAARAVPSDTSDAAACLLERALRGCVAELDARRPSWREERVGVVLGTSSGAMGEAELLFEALDLGATISTGPSHAERATYYGPMARALRCLGVPLDPCVLVLGACASATIAIGLATRWLDRGSCDLVLAGGFDAVTTFVAAGFEALRATTGSPPPRPFQTDRDGMSIGDGAAVLALARSGARSARSFVRGFGATSDAVHLTAPDREGRGLARAAAAALEEAGWPGVDLVSAHATATPFNDAAEFRALGQTLGEARAREVVVHAFKAQIGHTLGAGGALELLASLDAMDRGLLPASAVAGDSDPAAPARLLRRAEAGEPKTTLKLSSAFGGANAALVLGQGPQSSAAAVARARSRGPAFLHGGVHVARVPALESLVPQTRLSVDRLARADELVHYALAAVAELQAQCGPLAGAGIVVGTALGTIETNARFAARLRERGAASAEPRRFPYTSPNAAAGECSIAFSLTGPSFSVGGGMHAALEALACAALLVEAGDAAQVVVVAADHAGTVSNALAGLELASGAVAFLVTSLSATSRGASARARIGAIEIRRNVPSPSLPAAPAHLFGHRALVALARGAPSGATPAEVSCIAPPDGFARVRFEPV